MLRMMHDKVLVRPIERSKSEILEVIMTERFNLGEIMAVGPKATDVQPGQIVRYGEFSFPEYKEAGKTYQIIQEADIAAVVEG